MGHMGHTSATHDVHCLSSDDVPVPRTLDTGSGVRFQRLNGILELREVLEHLNQVLEHQVLEQHFRC